MTLPGYLPCSVVRWSYGSGSLPKRVLPRTVCAVRAAIPSSTCGSRAAGASERRVASEGITTEARNGPRSGQRAAQRPRVAHDGMTRKASPAGAFGAAGDAHRCASITVPRGPARVKHQPRYVDNASCGAPRHSTVIMSRLSAAKRDVIKVIDQCRQRPSPGPPDNPQIARPGQRSGFRPQRLVLHGQSSRLAGRCRAAARARQPSPGAVSSRGRPARVQRRCGRPSGAAWPVGAVAAGRLFDGSAGAPTRSPVGGHDARRTGRRGLGRGRPGRVRRAIVEIDSVEYHFRRADWQATLARHAALETEGYSVIHVPPSGPGRCAGVRRPRPHLAGRTRPFTRPTRRRAPLMRSHSAAV